MTATIAVADAHSASEGGLPARLVAQQLHPGERAGVIDVGAAGVHAPSDHAPQPGRPFGVDRRLVAVVGRCGTIIPGGWRLDWEAGHARRLSAPATRVARPVPSGTGVSRREARALRPVASVCWAGGLSDSQSSLANTPGVIRRDRRPLADMTAELKAETARSQR